MFRKPPHINEKALTMQIDRLFAHLSKHDPESEEYARINLQAEKLYKLRETDSNINSKLRDNYATFAGVGANLLAVVMVVKYEQIAVFTTKALDVVKKFR